MRVDQVAGNGLGRCVLPRHSISDKYTFEEWTHVWMT